MAILCPRVVKMKIGGTDITEDQRRIEAVLDEIGQDAQPAVDANGRFDLETALAYAKALRQYPLFYRYFVDTGQEEL